MNGGLDGLYTPERLPERVGAYSLRSCLKHAEDARVYLLEREGKKYILKRCSGAYAGVLREEYRLLRELELPFLPDAVDCFEADGAVWLLRSYIEGDTLAGLVERRGPFSEAAAVRCALGVCALLKTLHGRTPPVIHRDIKPENVVVTPEGGYALIDMGTARRFRDTAAEDTVVLGTRATAAPEQFGYAQTDVRTDIYGVGMLLIYLLTGDYAREEERLAGVSVRLRQIITTCTAFDPKRRYSDIAGLERALHSAGRPGKRGLPALLGVFLAGLAAGAAIGWFLPRPEEVPELVTFQEPLIEQAVRLELGKGPEEPITRKELSGVTQILICGDQVFADWSEHDQFYHSHSIVGLSVEENGGMKTLEDVRQLPYLRDLVADNQRIWDLSPLEGLPLVRLSVCNNPVADIAPLARCPALNFLSIEETGVSDLTPLGGLTGLKSLDASFTSVRDLSPLAGGNVQSLILIETPVEAYGALAQLPLDKLVLYGVDSGTVEMVATFSDLGDLTIYHSGITALGPLLELKALTVLDLTDNRVGSLEGVQGLSNLESLRVGDNPFTDLAPVEALRGLQHVELWGSGITDFTPLAALPTLQRVGCWEGQARLIEEQLPDAAFWIEVTG